MASKFVQPNKIRSSFFTAKPTKQAAPKPRPPIKPAAPPPTLEQQATSTVQGQLKPILDQINQAAQQRLQAGQQAITGYTSNLAQQLAGVPYGAPYAGAQEKQAAVDTALQQALAGGGGKLAADLQTRLAGIQDPSVAAAAGQVAQQGAAAGTTQLAQGGTALGALIANEAAAKNYGQQLPGIAGLAGLQDIRGLAGSVASDTGKQIAQIQGQAPSLINSTLGRLQSQQRDASKPNPTLSAAAGVLVNDYGQAITGKGGKPVSYTPYSKPGKPAAPRVVKGATSYYAVTPDGKVVDLGIPVAQAGKKTPAPKIVGSDATGRGVLHPDGTVTPLPGQWGQPAGGSTATGGKTTAQLQSIYDKAVAQATKLHSGTKDLLGNPKPVPFKDALRQVQAYFLGQGITDQTYARRQALKALAAAGYPVRADLIPPSGKAEAAQGAAYQPTAYTSGKLGAAQLPQLAQQALAIAAPTYANNANVQALVGRIVQESGGNPAAINLWDSNAKAGHPSQGLLQTIPSTFQTYALPGHTDIWNPLDNAIAAIRYMLARYGHIVGPSSTGY